MLKQILKILTISVIYNSLFAAGNLDTSFGVGGYAINRVGQESEARALVIQPDGKIIAVGNVFINNREKSIVARYNSNGSLDSTFSTVGTAIFDIPGHESFLWDVKIDWNSKIVVSGIIDEDEFPRGFVSRFLSNGTRDTTFGLYGMIRLDTIGINEDSKIFSIAIQSDGKIIAIGDKGLETEFGNPIKETIICRFNSDGSLDNSFGTNGIIMPPFEWSSGNKILLQTNNKILALMEIPEGSALARYNSNGTLDNTFGTGGIVQSNLSHKSMDLQSDGKIVLVGKFGDHFTLTRYNNNGTIDTSFVDGLNSIQYVEPRSMKLTLQNNGQIITSFNYQFGSVWKYKLVRFNADGTLDDTFGNNGIVESEAVRSRFVYEMAIQNDGKLVLCGSSSLPGVANDHLMLVRYKTASPTSETISELSEEKYIPYEKRPSAEKEEEEIETKKIKKD
ncbi:hypothetical protein M1446_04295 [Candidatus Dependentiae bacterium]|nr:hypothetical protein [Candidatus Dependentiae bacterium]